MKLLLHFERVSLRRAGRLLLENFDLALAPGEAVHLVGPNGVGKSSLIRLAAGLLEAEAGRIERSALALADDHLALDRELILERALRFWSGDVERAMDQLGIAHLAQVPVRLLSAGQAKRAMLARVLASRAPLWLLDEPLNGLDAEGADRLAHLMEEHCSSGGAVLAASHVALVAECRQMELPG